MIEHELNLINIFHRLSFRTPFWLCLVCLQKGLPVDIGADESSIVIHASPLYTHTQHIFVWLIIINDCLFNTSTCTELVLTVLISKVRKIWVGSIGKTTLWLHNAGRIHGLNYNNPTSHDAMMSRSFT